MIVLQGFGPNVMQRDVWELIICQEWEKQHMPDCYCKPEKKQMPICRGMFPPPIPVSEDLYPRI